MDISCFSGVVEETNLMVILCHLFYLSSFGNFLCYSLTNSRWKLKNFTIFKKVLFLLQILVVILVLFDPLSELVSLIWDQIY